VKKPRFQDRLDEESHAQRVARARVSEGDQEDAKALVAGMKQPGEAFIGKKRVVVSAARAKSLFEEHE